MRLFVLIIAGLVVQASAQVLRLKCGDETCESELKMEKKRFCKSFEKIYEIRNFLNSIEIVEFVYFRANKQSRDNVEIQPR